MGNLPIIVRDTREHKGHGYKFIKSSSCGGMVTEALPYGDYAIKDHLDLIVVERKASVNELCGNLGKYRERFEAELQRMVDANVRHKLVIVEGHWGDIYKLRRRYFGYDLPEELRSKLDMLGSEYGVELFIDDVNCKYVKGKSRIHPNAIFESINSLTIRFGVQFRFAGSAEMGHKMTRSLLLKAWKYRNGDEVI